MRAAEAAAGSGNEPVSPACDGPEVRFLCNLPTAMIPMKLAIVRERWGLSIEPVDHSRINLWKEYRNEGRLTKTDLRRQTPAGRSGIEIVIQKAPAPSAEFTLRGSVSGLWDEKVILRARNDLRAIGEHVRTLLQNLDERRVHPRIPVSFPVRVYPLYPDGIVGLPLAGRCKDISTSGVRMVVASPVWTERIYVEFFEFQEVSGHAVYVRVVRAMQDPESPGTITAGRFIARG
jgi:hypothetical protein